MDMAWRDTRPVPVDKSRGGLVFHMGVISDRYCLKVLVLNVAAPAYCGHNFLSFCVSRMSEPG